VQARDKDIVKAMGAFVASAATWRLLIMGHNERHMTRFCYGKLRKSVNFLAL
jgi:type II secretory pathway component PulM